LGEKKGKEEVGMEAHGMERGAVGMGTQQSKWE